MMSELLPTIDKFLAAEKIGEHRFGILAANNGRLVERLRAGGRIWPETEDRIRSFMIERRPDIFLPRPSTHKDEAKA